MFYRNSSSSDGLRSHCKNCTREYDKKRYDLHRDEILEGNQRYREKNKDKVAERHRRYRESIKGNSPRLSGKHRHRDKVKEAERGRKYRAENKGKENARARRWRAANKDAVSNRHRRYREANKSKIAEQRREWRARNREERRVYAQNRRAQEVKNGDGVTVTEWRKVLAKFSGKCAKCGSPDNIHMDHVVPISKGGSHSVNNVQPLCQLCNLQKYTKVEDWRGKAYQPLALELPK